MKKWMKWITLALCTLFLAALLPVQAAFADEEPFEQTVTIESEKNGAFDYLEYYSGGSWHDLNTPRHWVESTGQVCYCIEHRKGNPHGSTYTAAAPSAVFGAETLAGLQTILMFGYPCNTPEGFTEDEARQATANAIRFWLSENGEEGSYSFTNRKAHPTYIRAKRGYEHVLTWADQLLQMARDKKTLSHSITFTPSALTLTKSADVFTGSTAVELMNINSGYTIDTSSLPEGVSMTGYTGTKSETVSFTAPLSKASQTFTVTAVGKDTRSLENITAYIPSGTSLQKIFLCATVAQVVSRAGIGINTPDPPVEGHSHTSGHGWWLERLCLHDNTIEQAVQSGTERRADDRLCSPAGCRLRLLHQEYALLCGGHRREDAAHRAGPEGMVYRCGET